MNSEWIKSTIMDAEGQMSRAFGGKGKETLDANTIIDLIEIAKGAGMLQLYAEYVDSCLNLGLKIDTFGTFERITKQHIEILKGIGK